MAGAGAGDRSARRGLARRLAHRAVDPVAAQLAAPVAERLVAVEGRLAALEACLAELAGLVERARDDTAEVVRILGDQGDAVGEAAELTGRVLARLGTEVQALTDELAGRRTGGTPG